MPLYLRTVNHGKKRQSKVKKRRERGEEGEARDLSDLQRAHETHKAKKYLFIQVIQEATRTYSEKYVDGRPSTCFYGCAWRQR